jgi:hypothetical protein
MLIIATPTRNKRSKAELAEEVIFQENKNSVNKRKAFTPHRFRSSDGIDILWEKTTDK